MAYMHARPESRSARSRLTPENTLRKLNDLCCLPDCGELDMKLIGRVSLLLGRAELQRVHVDDDRYSSLLAGEG